jgi:nucleotide-binding universal stress UspA family protein
MMFKRILVPTDGSKLSQKAVSKAIELARFSHAAIVALHVRPRFSDSRQGIYDRYEDHVETDYDRQVKSESDLLFAQINERAQAAGVAVDSALVSSNDVWRAIIAAAKRKKCDLICMASHGRGGLSAVVLGSETAKVLTHSTIPVLVLR